jgi:hypothetical protein
MTWYDPKVGERTENDTNLEEGFGQRHDEDEPPRLSKALKRAASPTSERPEEKVE